MRVRACDSKRGRALNMCNGPLYSTIFILPLLYSAAGLEKIK
jgi:hypothetical protein